MSKIGAIILAGGKSERMGQDKALLTHAGMTFLELTAAAVMPLVDEIVVVADTPNKYPFPCGRVLSDIFPDCGPAGGILTGLNALGEGWHFVLACDMPTVQTNVLQLLLKAAGPEYQAVIPEAHGRFQPLCAVYSHLAAPRLMRFLEQGGGAMQEALKTLGVKKIGEGVLRRIDPHLHTFLNINTPEDLDALNEL